jgi:hypothetical protein
MLSTIFHSKTFAGALAGLTSAMIVDIGAFRGWKKWQDALTYDWGIASFRWFQGVVIGAITGAGYGALIG